MHEIQLIPVSKAGEYIEVHPTALAAHKSLGWVECERQEQASEQDVAEAVSRSVGVAAMRAALTEKGIQFRPDASKAEIRELYEASI